jgi:sugar lactone lactonase YvrE
LFYPKGVAVDSIGNVYIADNNNQRLRVVNTTGFISTFAGTGQYGNSGDGGKAALATFQSVTGVAIDSKGNIYILDRSSSTVRQVNTSGFIHAFAGNGSYGFGGDGGLAISSAVDSPDSIAVDTQDSIYICDTNNFRIRRVNSSGIITTVAGSGSDQYTGDGQIATVAGVPYPQGVASDTNGNIYISGNACTVRKVTSTTNIISTFAGSSTRCDFGGDGGAAVDAVFNNVAGIATDSNGNLYICDSINNRIRKVSPFASATGFATTGPASSGIVATSATATVTSSGTPAMTAQAGVAAPIFSQTAIIGIAAGVGGTALVIAVVAVIIVIARKRRSPRAHQQTSIQLSNVSVAKLIKNIQIQERLGGGEFGEVYKGIWQVIHPLVSIYEIFFK